MASPAIPKSWDPEALHTFEVPLAKPEASPHFLIDADFYYRIPVTPIYKSYPVYTAAKEPPGYLEWLKKQTPEITFDPAKLKTEGDWARAGELVFDVPLLYEDYQSRIDQIRSPKWAEAVGLPIARDGTIPFRRYVIREKGKVEVGNFSCSMCHTRVMPDGSVIKGAQGNYPQDRVRAYEIEEGAKKAQDAQKYLAKVRGYARNAFGAPWVAHDPATRYATLSLQDILALWRAIPPGVQARFATSVFNPVQVPDLIGVKDRKYLDRTGLARHRSVGDLMRYAMINQGAFLFAAHADFKFNENLPPPETMGRYSDEQLYALSLYLYSLSPPENPHRFDVRAARGKAIFKRQGCFSCHTPPLYTSNKLTPVDGFTVPPNHPDRESILDFSVGTDPGLTLETRRGTGFYKVPSLKGVWYRGPLQHSGQVATLEEWFDPRRLEDSFVSQGGFRLPGATSGAVRGHEFGLELSDQERKDLIAFLRTL
jgi:mono/diheme cytochrome c family protein